MSGGVISSLGLLSEKLGPARYFATARPQDATPKLFTALHLALALIGST